MLNTAAGKIVTFPLHYKQGCNIFSYDLARNIANFMLVILTIFFNFKGKKNFVGNITSRVLTENITKNSTKTGLAVL
jgi:hypothetical protein